MALSRRTSSELKSTYINYTVQKEHQASGIAVLPWRNHQVDIVMLYEHVADSIVIHHGILGLRIALNKIKIASKCNWFQLLSNSLHKALNLHL